MSGEYPGSGNASRGHCTQRCARVVYGALILAGLAATSALELGAQGRPTACREGWSSRLPLLTQDGRPVYVDQPDVVSTTRGLTLIGSPTFIWPAAELRPEEEFLRSLLTSSQDVAGVVLDSAGRVERLIPMPPGVHVMRQSRTLPASSGAAHVFWASIRADSSGTGQPEPSIESSIWYAGFDGAEWTIPEQVLDADHVFMGRTTVSMLEAHGTLHVAASASVRQPVYRAGIQYARRSADGTWSAQWIDFGPHGGAVRYVALAALRPRGEMLLAFTGQVRDVPDQVGEHGLYIVRSVDAGASWSAPRMVRHLGLDSGFYLDVAHLESGEIVLLWTTRREAAAHPSDIEVTAHLLSTGDGHEWRQLPDLVPTGGVPDRLPMVATRDGLLVLDLDPSNDRLRLWSRASGGSTGGLVEGAWGEPSTLELAGPPSHVTFSSPERDDVHAVWGRIRPFSVAGRGLAIVPEGELATYRVCADSRARTR